MRGLSRRTRLTHAVLDKSPYLCRAWIGYVSRYVGSCVPALRKLLVVTTAAYFCERYVALAVIAWHISRDML